jgi:hypothetical protein
MTRKAPEIIEVTSQRIEELLERAASNTLRDEDRELIRDVFTSYIEFFQIVGDKNTSIRRLRQILFGAQTEKTANIFGSDTPSDDRDDTTPEVDDTEPKKGHGRHGAEAYQGADQVDVSHESLKAGDLCPQCEQGTVYEVATPGVLVRIVGQAPLHATVYHLQKLRCHLCGKVFTADPPEDAGARKFDATAGSMIALLKYGSGMPFNRLAGLQRNLAIPLPASTQWDVIAAFAPSAAPAYEALISQAAQGDVLHNDDTTVKILDLMGERAKKQPAEDDTKGRTGLFTSGVVSTCEGRRITLFFSGRQHAGENLADVLQHRAEELQRPIQMCDGLSRNLPGELETIVANCLAHSRRRFADVADRFENESKYVLDALTVVYRTDAEARKRRLSPAKRLQLHRTKSQQTMTRLHNWLQRQFDDKLVEPNSALGEAITYMLNHWEKLTRFLQVAGAPLDNNICERALKKAILHRKNALFYKSQRGARIGDMYMSLIYTCEQCDVSPFEYLTELHRNADRVAAEPDNWMPWNYRAATEADGVLVQA